MHIEYMQHACQETPSVQCHATCGVKMSWNPCASNLLLGVQCCTEVAQGPEEAKHLFLVISKRSSTLFDRFRSEPLMVVNARTLPIEYVNVVADHLSENKQVALLCI